MGWYTRHLHLTDWLLLFNAQSAAKVISRRNMSSESQVWLVVNITGHLMFEQVSEEEEKNEAE